MSAVASPRVLSPRARRLVWLGAGVSAIGTIVAILFGARVAEPTPTPRDSFTGGPLGHRAFLETLDALGVHAARDRRGDFAAARAPMLFVEPATEALLGSERVALADALDARVAADRISVVVLPKWRLSTGEVAARAVPDAAAADVLEAALPGASLDHVGAPTDDMEARTATGALGTFEVSVPWPQVIRSPADETLLAIDGGALVVRRADGVIVVSDPDLLHSWNLHRGDHALLWRDLVTRRLGTDAVSLDEVFHGHFERPSLGAALASWPTVALTAQILLLLLLVVWLGSRRFGPPRPPAPLGRGPAESIAVSAHVLAEGRPAAALADGYVRAQIADLAERLGLPPGKSAVEQARHVDAVAARRGEPAEAERLLAAADAVEPAPSEGGRANDPLALARRAHALRERLLQLSRDA